MKIHNLRQGSPEWLAYRAQHFNASDAPAMMGVSPYKTRAELLRELHTGVAAEIDEGTQRRYDNGHRAEALARPLAEEFIGQELYPVTGSNGRLSASFDGLTLDYSIGFEHKALNNELRECFRRVATPEYRECDPGRELPIYHRVQMEQQLMISGAEKVLFMASQWNGEELVEEQHCWYFPDAALRAEIVAGWDQFAKDLAAYKLPEAAEPAPVGKAPEALPALLIEVTGKVTSSNLADFKRTALAAIGSVNRDLKTDKDFADAAKAVKWCSEVEERLAAAKQHALSQTSSIDELFRTIDEISGEARRVRLDLDKLVTRRKTEVKEEAVVRARAALHDHYAVLNAELAPGASPILPTPLVDFAGAIKGLRSFDSMQEALDTLLAKSKISADMAARAVRSNMAALREQADGFGFLFPDLHQIVTKAPEDFAMVIRARIAEHKQAEADKVAAAKAAEEQRQARLDADRKARIDARIAQLETALVEYGPLPSGAIDAKRMAIMANEPSEDLYGDRLAEAVKLRSQVLIALGEQHQAALVREEAAAQAARDELAAKAAAQVAAEVVPVATPMPPAAAPVHRAPVAEVPTLKLGVINERLGFVMTSDFLASLGFTAHTDRSARLYREGDFSAICAAISAHVLAVAAEIEQAV
ncbi:YqaJ viral recombinase family protein [Roseateles depolymerans]|uniref:Uncharacterized protein n=1 Tax=Roseateles depolymerans TaxID=76731 RepID=A0A0U3N381_9BURK|nr:YqaJ viral recombinase family protein [Roseateles depolymerans]ALV06667.1 hypothetical protein RD2015_2195 [Roseateles depolymerans]REG19644.1 putative phage-type endonuclease [Roseateles depolymerans]